MICYIHWQTSWTLPTELEGRDIKINGFIANIPEASVEQANFIFELDKVEGKKAKGLIRLSWRAPMMIKAGESWQFTARLKKIHGLSNPGGFDYEAWTLLQGIRAQGYIKKGNAIKLSHKKFYLQQCRQLIYDKLTKYLPHTTTSPWIIALALGERHHITPDNWQVLRNTGTNHLMAIAGLHIGFMSTFVYALVFYLWKHIPYLVLRCPAQLAGGVASFGMVVLYSLLAGFSVPTQRACFMFTSFIILFLLRREFHVWQSFCIGLFAVLLMNPLDILSESFWLSFVSIALIIYGMKSRWKPRGLWWKYGKIQWVIGLGLIPLSLKFFQQFSLLSFIVNSIAIPWITFLVLPLILIGTALLFISIKIGSLLLQLSDQSLQILWHILTYFSSISFSTWSLAIPNLFLFLIGSLGILLLLSPIGLPGRGFSIFLLLPLFFYQSIEVKRGELLLTLLDVGQGLSLVIQTQGHVLVFDTGARLNDSYDMGASVVAPYLRQAGIKSIDMLVISHGDNDHSGGAGSIIKEFEVKKVKTSVPEKFAFPSALCLQNQAWRWDGVDFIFLSPSPKMLGLGNNSSCVLKISNGRHSILLTGDIEKEAEKDLIQSEAKNLAADILIAPHHGSKTSGLLAFIEKVNPKIVLFPVGYKNRYHFPHPSVVKTYEEHQVILYDSVNSGAISFLLSSENNDLTPRLYRKVNQHFWYNLN